MIATSNFVNQMHNGSVVNNTTAIENLNSSNSKNENNSQLTSDYNDHNEDNLIDQNFNNEVNPDIHCEHNVDVESHQNNEEQNEESIDITISNVVSNFSVCCHLNLRQIATTGSNVVYKREQSIILMKLRQPQVTASIWSSGKITCTGATTEESAKCASRKVARCLQKLGFRVRFSSYRIVNVLGACRLPFGIKIHEFSDLYRPQASYEPELHPGATYRIKELKATLKIFQTGSITITAPSIQNVQLAVEHIYPLVYEFRKPKPISENDVCTNNNNSHNIHNTYPFDNDDVDDTLLTEKILRHHNPNENDVDDYEEIDYEDGDHNDNFSY